MIYTEVSLLNKPLFKALTSLLGEGGVVNEDTTRYEVAGARLAAGESYLFNCPHCGDIRKRLSVSYLWLSNKYLSSDRITFLIHCYNEECEEVYSDEFREKVLKALEGAEVANLFDNKPQDIQEDKVITKMHLPIGYRLLTDLEFNHPAILFLNSKYNIPIEYLSKFYKVGFTDQTDDLYRGSKDRIVFPIFKNGNIIAWQGRSIHNNVIPRWYLPPGFSKVDTLFNFDNITPMDIPIICEGIPSAIACGPKAIAIFGSTISDKVARILAERCSSAILALDPDTYVPDNRPGGKGKIKTKAALVQLNKYLKVPAKALEWPKDAIDLATRKNNNENINVPDAADYGLQTMSEFIQKVS